jgi:transposase
MTDKQVRAQYTQEFRLEAVRQVQAGQAQSVVAKVLGIPKATLGKWVRQASTIPSRVLTDKTKPVTPEQMELTRLRAEVARLRMERDIAKKAAAYFAQDTLRGTPGYTK